LLFGLITRRELEKLLDERDRQLKREREEMAFEWARWFDKFRSLYAQWLKRDKKAVEDPSGSTIVDESSPQGVDPRSVQKYRFPNSRRGF